MTKIFDPKQKILANLDYVAKLLVTGYSPPILVEVDPSNACNHGCPFCISSYIHLPESKGLETYDRSVMAKDILFRLCYDLMKIGVKAVNWTGGGEPTVNPHLKDAISILGWGGIKQGIFTNGTLLDKYDLFQVLIDFFSWVRISVDAGTPDSYNAIRRVRQDHGWDKMVSNLKKLTEINKGQIDIGVGFVITPHNYKEILDFANFFKEFDVTYLQYKPEIVNREREGGIQRTLEFWKNDVFPLLEQAQDILGDKFQLNGYKLRDLTENTLDYGRTYKRCFGSQLSPCVGADGHVYVCTNHRGYKQYSYGSLYKRSFIEIWKDVALRKMVMDVIEKDEKFCNCTQLCKPHESNKILWDLYETIHDPDLKHSEFV